MKGFVCWNREDVPTIMDTDADFTSDHIFNAVHIPVSIKKRFRAGTEADSVTYSPEELLRDLQDDNIKHLVLPVLGASGSGKSHLVRWLYTNIQRNSPREEILLIPKAGTNLKKIIQLILGNREGKEFEEYRKRLEQSSKQVDPVAGRQMLLDKLAQLITFNPIEYYLEKKTEVSDKGLWEYAKNNLPKLLYDPHFRDGFWLKKGGVIEQLYDLAFGTTNKRERLEDRRKLQPEDLPIDMFDFTAAGQVAQDFVGKLMASPELVSSSVDLLNITLDEALKELLLAGEDLTQLMNDVRRQLHKEGITLILLIEDFAKMQGIDSAILEAIIQQSTVENKMCPIRTVFACTTGYYERIPDTFRTRIGFTVWVEYAAETKPYNKFLAHYMNATRIGDENLKQSYSEFQTNGENGHWKVSNACLSCDFMRECHSTFGAVDGMGLYPFNEVAAQNMYERVSQDFTPREFINRVIREVSYRFAPDIARMDFPNKALHQNFGGKVLKLRSNEVLNLKSKYGQKEADRTIALMEFWSDRSGGVIPEIYEIFEVKQGDENRTVSLTDQSIIPVSNSKEPSKETPVATRPSAYDKLNDWMNGSVLDQVTTRELRTLLFKAIEAYIDWNALDLYKGLYFGKGSAYHFKEEKIFFRIKTESNHNKDKISLVLPLDEENRVSTTMALQGLIMYDHYKNWNFDHGVEHFLELSKNLSKWSASIVNQIKEHSEENSNWDPLQSIIQWMYFYGRLCGNIKHDATLFEVWDQLHHSIKFDHLEFRTAPFQSYIKTITKNTDQLNDQLWKHALCSKGNVIGVKYFDIARVIPILESVHKSKYPNYKTPDDVRKYFENLQKLDESYSQKFSDVSNAELKEYADISGQIGEVLGEPEEVGLGMKSVRELLIKLDEEGLTNHFSKGVYEQIAAFANQTTVRFEHAYRNSLQLLKSIGDKDSKYPEVISRLGKADMKKQVKELNDFLIQVLALVQRVQNAIDQEILTKKEANQDNIESIKGDILNYLETLSHYSDTIHNLQLWKQHDLKH